MVGQGKRQIKGEANVFGLSNWKDEVVLTKMEQTLDGYGESKEGRRNLVWVV